MAEAVRSMFARIAPGYDRANATLSFGLHHRWRRAAVRLAQPPRGASVLDVATGTGDLAFAFRRALGRRARVVGLDFCAPMLERARDKAHRFDLNVEFQEGDALRLDFPDAAFDIAAIGFGIRNVDQPLRCLREMARVTRPGGRVVVLEFGQPGGLRRWPFRVYSRWFIPLVGGILTGHTAPYRYLVRTSSEFPAGEAFVHWLEKTNRFAGARAVPLSGGIAYAYVAVVSSGTNGARVREAPVHAEAVRRAPS